MADILRGAAQITTPPRTCLVYGVLAYGAVLYIHLENCTSQRFHYTRYQDSIDMPLRDLVHTFIAVEGMTPRL